MEPLWCHLATLVNEAANRFAKATDFKSPPIPPLAPPILCAISTSHGELLGTIRVSHELTRKTDAAALSAGYFPVTAHDLHALK
jgi:hypothetical protein